MKTICICLTFICTIGEFATPCRVGYMESSCPIEQEESTGKCFSLLRWWLISIQGSKCSSSSLNRFCMLWVSCVRVFFLTWSWQWTRRLRLLSTASWGSLQSFHKCRHFIFPTMRSQKKSWLKSKEGIIQMQIPSSVPELPFFFLFKIWL